MEYQKGIIIQTLDVPKKESKEGVFTSYLELRLVIAQIMKDANYNSTDPRIAMVVDLMISGLPSKKIQETLRKLRDKRIDEETKNLSTSEEKGKKMQHINIEIAGEIAPYMDMYTGGERINRLSFIIPIKEMEKVMKNANPEHFEEHFGEGEK